MFDNLTAKLNQIFKKLKGYGKLTEKNIQDALKEVRLSLLEADVHFKVVKDFIESVKGRALGHEVMRSLTPGQQFVKIVKEELTSLMGSYESRINLSGSRPHPIMLIGLHGCGKTTTAAKLAKYLKGKGYNPLLVSSDVYRPAAGEQLEILGKQLGIGVFPSNSEKDTVGICIRAKRFAYERGFDTLIIDTAGRLHIDEEMMDELEKIKKAVEPKEVLLVADAMTGQDAVNIAREFFVKLQFDGIILTKMDGDARGGAALSIKAVTSRPIKFIGVGEKLDALEPFHPDRMASRVLGMGDVLSLIEKAEASLDQEKAMELEERIRKNIFTLEDFRDQLRMIKRMGPLEELLRFIPGMDQLKGIKVDGKEIIRIEAIINSMTKKERQNPTIIDGSRRRRIAKGSGTNIQDVNKLLKNYLYMKKMISRMQKVGIGRVMKDMRSLLPF